MQRRVVGDEVALIHLRAGVQQQSRNPGVSTPGRLPQRAPGLDQVIDLGPALQLEDALVPAFVVEEHPDGRYTVFVPSVPTPAAGTVYILDHARVHLVDVPFAKAVSVISKWGAGSRDLLEAMKESRE